MVLAKEETNKITFYKLPFSSLSSTVNSYLGFVFLPRLNLICLSIHSLDCSFVQLDKVPHMTSFLRFYARHCGLRQLVLSSFSFPIPYCTQQFQNPSQNTGIACLLPIFSWIFLDGCHFSRQYSTRHGRCSIDVLCVHFSLTSPLSLFIDFCFFVQCKNLIIHCVCQCCLTLIG